MNPEEIINAKVRKYMEKMLGDLAEKMDNTIDSFVEKRIKDRTGTESADEDKYWTVEEEEPLGSGSKTGGFERMHNRKNIEIHAENKGSGIMVPETGSAIKAKGGAIKVHVKGHNVVACDCSLTSGVVELTCSSRRRIL
ncbi:hypothetical protein NDU88_010320 [Pleurodeles waltl]|uniref:Uncharacterized protein n=1 Tax=Pleurodeles waltl TaxID=8319 RepID=A0AAV7S1K4_PLEWA|nr:hypothetical protein NDU88_010320 [Pleurodeles waltl]